MGATYEFEQVETSWQRFWEEHQTFRARNPGDPGFDPARRKYYVLDFFPYPSGAGLHVGHPEGYTATDILARYARMRGRNVLHPMGWDAFGLPAEQYAVETNTHPRITTERNIARFREQLKRLGFSFDWSREFATTDPDYYRWTQWIFLHLYNSYYDAGAGKTIPIAHLIQQFEAERLAIRFDGEVVAAPAPGLQQISGLPPGLRYWHELNDAERREVLDSRRLAYLAEVPVNWCPALGTVLANEEVTSEGRSERGNHPVFRRPLKQWMLRITAFADRLERDLGPLDWPESVKLMQRNWIGRSEGAEVEFGIEGSEETLRIFTTRPDTLFGATYMVLAPEHPLVGSLTTAEHRDAVQRYVSDAQRKTDLARTADVKEKTGVFIGGYALNPVWPKGDARGRIPIWVADYVLMSYGTGAIMAVPGHDERDWEFAVEMDLLISVVVHAQGQRYCNSTPIILDAADTNFVHSPVGPVVEFRSAGPKGDWISFASEDDASTFFQNRNYKYGKIIPTPSVAEGKAVNSPPLAQCGTGVSPVSSVSGAERITRRNLPHIQRGGSSYFVTFRTKSSTLSNAERSIVIRACDYWHEKKATIHAAVVMPDHVHLLLTPQEHAPEQWVPLSEILHSIKSYTAHEIVKLRNQSGPVWLDESFDRLIRNESEFVEKWEYIESNPVTAGLVKQPSDYQWLVLRQIGSQDADEASAASLPHRRDAGATSLVSQSQETNSVAPCDINGLPSAEAKRKIIDWLSENDLGARRVNYKLRDWLFSRQRYWGEPFPIVHCGTCGPVALPESALPLLLPEISNFQPVAQAENATSDPEPPLGRAGAWAHTKCPRCGREGRRELNTMPNWAGSCWYYLRFLEPKNERALVSREAERYWMVSNKSDGTPHWGGVDLYVGGAEHAVLHLLYARFWHKVLFDLGYVSTPEPFGKLFNQGMIRAFAYRDGRGVAVGYDEIDFRDDGAYRREGGEKLAGTVEKMSKSLKNVINPDDVVREYGADSLRLYEMFMGPLDASKPWNPRDVPGVFRFLQRVWRLVVDPETGALSSRIASRPRGSQRADDPVERALHKTIKKVTDDLDAMAFNTAIAAMMEFVNAATRAERIERDQLERFVLILAPFAPHIAEELWKRLRGAEWAGSLAYEAWPTHDEAMIVEDEIEIAVQVNGKLASTLRIAANVDEAGMQSAALADAKVQARLAGKTVRKVVVVKGRLVNVVGG